MTLETQHRRAAAATDPSLIRRSLDEFGGTVDVQDVQGGDFIPIDGQPYQDGRGDEIKIFPAFDDDPQAYYGERTALMGKYYINKDTVAFVSPDGVLHVGPSSRSNLELLQKAGYQTSRFFVPMTDGGSFVHPDAHRKWIEIKEKAYHEWKQSSLEYFKA